MKYLKKVLSFFVVTGITASLFTQVTFAASNDGNGGTDTGDAPAVDYAIYYSAETGFLKNNESGEPLTDDEIPDGMSAEGDTITLKDVSFATTQSAALVTEGDMTLNIPENSRTVISVENSEPEDPEAEEESSVFGLLLMGNNVIQADGELSVTARGAKRTCGLASYGDLTVKGSGEVTAAEYDGTPFPFALFSTENLTIEDSVHVYAHAHGDDPYASITSVISRQLTVKDDAVLDTSGGSNANGISIWDGYDIITEGNASIIADGSIILFGNETVKPGAIRASGNSTVSVKCGYDVTDDSILAWGICGGPNGGDDAPADEIAMVYVSDNASVSVSVTAKDGGVIGRAKAADGVRVTGGNAESDKYALEYDGETYVIPGTEDNAHYALFEPDSSESGVGGTADQNMHPAGFAYEGKAWFKDVPSDAWYYDAVKQVYEKGLMNGIGLNDSEFAPDMTLTRGMLAAILGRMDGVQSTDTATEYTDVSTDAYYAPYVAWGTKNGILNGMGDGTFRPNDPVTREQAAKIIKAYCDYKGEGPTGAWAIRLNYTDLAKISDWAAEGVMFCTMKSIMTGRDNNIFDPQANITRAECAAVIGRIQ